MIIVGPIKISIVFFPSPLKSLFSFSFACCTQSIFILIEIDTHITECDLYIYKKESQFTSKHNAGTSFSCYLIDILKIFIFYRLLLYVDHVAFLSLNKKVGKPINFKILENVLLHNMLGFFFLRTQKNDVKENSKNNMYCELPRQIECRKNESIEIEKSSKERNKNIVSNCILWNDLVVAYFIACKYE